MSRLISIGDIHGCCSELTELIELIQPSPKDRFVFLGDYIDRGPLIFKTIESLITFKEMFPETVFLMGNHERMFLDFLSPDCTRDNKEIFLYNGGYETIASYKNNGFESQVGKIDFLDLPESHQIFYNELKVFHKEGDFLFVHAGVNPAFELEKQTTSDMLWIRDYFLKSRELMVGKDIIVVHGHTPMRQKELEIYHKTFPNKINVDSGAVFGYSLTACDVLSRKTWKVKSCRSYR